VATHALQGSEIRTLGAAWREFRSKTAPWLIAAAIAAALCGRAALGTPTWRDAAAVAFMLVVYPFGEWAIHVHLLHQRPFRVRGHKIDLVSARSHRRHHEQPHRLDLINFSPLEVLAILLLAVPTAVAIGAGLTAAAFGRPPLAPLVSMTLTGYVLVGVYEWTHFLIHTAHRPRSRYYRSIWRNHRLHHFKNEHYWHGITNTVSDRVLGTFPDQHEIRRSPTVQALDSDR
jgi:hypothetical protein